MFSRLQRLDVIALLSAIPASIAFQMNGAIYGWIIYAMAFYAFLDATPRECFKRGVLVGIGAGIINFSWILIGGSRFTGKGVWLSVGIVAGLTLFIALYIGLLAWIYGMVKWRKKMAPESLGNLINAVIISCIFVLFDSFMINVADSFALILYVTYIPIASDLYAIQPAAIFGPLILTFIIVFVNGQIAHILYYRVWQLLYLPVVSIGVYYLMSFVILKSYENRAVKEKAFDVAILTENLVPEFKWDEKNGNEVVNQLFRLTKEATQKKANLVVWSESAIPWNFSPEDDFLMEIAKLTSAQGVSHLIGMNTSYKENTFYNSIYCLQPDFQITGRYDKRLPLSLIEKPIGGLVLPFYNNHGFLVKEADKDQPINTPYGKAGILLCNESTIPYLAYESVRGGARFLVNPGNDGWFADTYIARQHFYHARLRAVETRRDVIVNNNAGYSGLIRSSGEIETMEKKQKGGVTMVKAQTNNLITIAVIAPYLFTILSFITLLVLSIIGRISYRVTPTTLQE